MNPKNDEIFSSANFVQNSKNHIESIIKNLISSDFKFAIILKAENITLSPSLDIFPNKEEFLRFDIVNYSFETAEIIDDKFVFRAGFGSGANVEEAEVSMKLFHIFQILTLDTKPLFQNFSKPKLDENLERRNLFLSKNKGLFGK